MIYAVLVCKIFGLKIQSCKFFDKSHVCPWVHGAFGNVCCTRPKPAWSRQGLAGGIVEPGYSSSRYTLGCFQRLALRLWQFLVSHRGSQLTGGRGINKNLTDTFLLVKWPFRCLETFYIKWAVHKLPMVWTVDSSSRKQLLHKHDCVARFAFLIFCFVSSFLFCLCGGNLTGRFNVTPSM